MQSPHPMVWQPNPPPSCTGEASQHEQAVGNDPHRENPDRRQQLSDNVPKTTPVSVTNLVHRAITHCIIAHNTTVGVVILCYAYYAIAFSNASKPHHAIHT